MDMSMTSTAAAMTSISTTSTKYMSTATLVSSATTSSAAMDMSGMSGMGMGGGDACKISMVWNWYTIDSCFLSESWHVRSSGAFAGSCIGVILLVMVLEGLRRASREYEAFLVRTHLAKVAPLSSVPTTRDSDSNEKSITAVTQPAPPCPPVKRQFRPTLFEQLVRALLHMLQFAVAYIIMLLAMYFNGYIIICIFIGAFLGAFVFSWHDIALPGEEREITYCCG